MTREDGKIATRQRRTPEAWLAAVEQHGTAIDEMTPIAPETAVEEMLMMGLRLVEGVPRTRLERVLGGALEARFATALPALIEGGFLVLDEARLAATPVGRQRLNAVLAALLA